MILNDLCSLWVQWNQSKSVEWEHFGLEWKPLPLSNSKRLRELQVCNIVKTMLCLLFYILALTTVVKIFILTTDFRSHCFLVISWYFTLDIHSSDCETVTSFQLLRTQQFSLAIEYRNLGASRCSVSRRLHQRPAAALPAGANVSFPLQYPYISSWVELHRWWRAHLSTWFTAPMSPWR